MEDKIRLRVLGLSYSQVQSGAYALLLSEENGSHKIPIVIGSAEAQSIAIKIEGIVPTRPLTHDLFVSFAHAFGVKLTEVYIYKFEDGIFYSELTFSDGQRTVQLDARTSDAIAIAMRTHTPIFTTREVINETGFVVKDEELADDEPDNSHDNGDDLSLPGADYFAEPKLENYAIEELERTLQQLTEDENYEEAARVNEILQRKKAARDGKDNNENQE